MHCLYNIVQSSICSPFPINKQALFVQYIKQYRVLYIQTDFFKISNKLYITNIIFFFQDEKRYGTIHSVKNNNCHNNHNNPHVTIKWDSGKEGFYTFYKYENDIYYGSHYDSPTVMLT